MLTLLNTCHDIIGIFDFMERVLLGLTDKFDIKILSHLTLVQLSNLFPSAVLQSKLPSFFVLLLFAFLAPPKFLCVCKSIEIEDFVAPLEVTINTKMKDTAVKQEIEKNEELVRSSLRGVVALSRLPESGSNPFFSFSCERLGLFFFFFCSLHLFPDSNPRFAAFLKALKASEHNAKLEAIFAETEARDGGIDSMDTS